MRRWSSRDEQLRQGRQHVRVAELRANLPSDALPGDFVFGVKGTPRSNMAMAQLLRRMGHSSITTHGFRSAFRDWAGDTTDYPRELIEQALAHTISNKAERAYRRGTAIDKRRQLMEDWAVYLSARGSAHRLAENSLAQR